MTETTTTTGWHVHAWGDPTVHSDGACPADSTVSEKTRPVVVLDPADPTVRETIARALFGWEQCDKQEMRDLDGNWDGRLNDDDQAEYREMADAVLAALVSGGRA